VAVTGPTVKLSGFKNQDVGRPDARLKIDPGTVVKLTGTRIDAQSGPT